MKGFIRDLASVGLSKGGEVIFGLLRSIIIARWLGPESNGLIAALAVYPSLFMTFGSLGIRQSTTYFVGKNVFDEEKLKQAIVHIWIISTIVSVIASFLLMRFFSSSGEKLLWVLLSILPIPFTLFNTYNSGLFLGKNRIKEFNRINWLPSFFIMLFAALSIIVFKMDVSGALLSACFGPLLMSVMLLNKNKFYKSFTAEIDFKIIKALLSLGIIYALALLVINLNYKVDVILLDKLSSPYQLGIYSKGAALIEYLWQIPMLLSTIIFARSATSKDSRVFSLQVQQLLRLSFIAIGLGCLAMFICADFIIVTLFGSKFQESGQVLRNLIPGVLLLTIFKVLNMDLAGRGKPWISMKAMVPALLVNLVLNIIFIPKYGANAASISSTVSYTVAAVLFLHFYSVEVQVPMTDIVRYSKSDFAPVNKILNVIKGQTKTHEHESIS